MEKFFILVEEEEINLIDIRLHRFNDNQLIKSAAYWHIDTLEEIDENLIPKFSFIEEAHNPIW